MKHVAIMSAFSLPSEIMERGAARVLTSHQFEMRRRT
jgi:hypothetical protein